MIQINFRNVDVLTQFPVMEGCSFTSNNKAAKHGMAFDSTLGDFVLSCAHDVSVGLIVDYIIMILLTQKDDRGPRNVYVENNMFNINSISDEELKSKIKLIVEEELKKQK